MGKGYSIKKEQRTIITPIPKGDFDLDKPNRTKYQPPPTDPVYHPDDFYDGVPKEKRRRAIIADLGDETIDIG